MLCYVVLNGEWLNEISLDKDAKIIAADGALKFLEKHSIVPDRIVGDFDSYGKIPLGAKVFPSEKNLTDGEIALAEAVKMGANQIEFLCAGGLREDHFLCNLNLLLLADNMGISAKAVTNFSDIYYLKPNTLFKKRLAIGTTVSLIAIDDCHVSHFSGVKYDYPKTELKRASTLGVSNLTVDEEFELEIDSGCGYVFINKTK